MSPLAPTSPNPFAIFSRQSIGADAANTLSSWSNCMAQAYCKWPVIVAIIIGALIVLSVVICCARCLCCGLECCCWCCSCCNKCCPSPRGGKGKYSQPPQQQNYQYPPNQPYGYNPAMTYGPPQFATFDASTGKVTEDSLPAMPSWETSQSRHVEDTSYRGAGADDALNKEMGGATGGIAMDAMHPKEPVQYYENPEEPYQPMLSSQEHQQPGNDDQLPYHDTASNAATSYAATRLGSPQPQANPLHPDGQYNQQQDPYAPYGQGRSPTSNTYAGSYPPTYHTREPSASYNRDPHPVESPYTSPTAGSAPPFQQNNDYRNFSRGPSSSYAGGPDFSRSQSTNYGPVSPMETPPAEMPGSLMAGGGQRYPSSASQQQQQPHELSAMPGSIYRKPPGGSGSWQ